MGIDPFLFFSEINLSNYPINLSSNNKKSMRNRSRGLRILSLLLIIVCVALRFLMNRFDPNIWNVIGAFLILIILYLDFYVLKNK